MGPKGRILSAAVAVPVTVLIWASPAFAHSDQGTQGTDNGSRAIADPVDQSFIVGNIEAGAFAHGADDAVFAGWTHNPTCGLHVH